MRVAQRWRWYTWITMGFWGLSSTALSWALARPLVESFGVLLGNTPTMPSRPGGMLPLAAGLAMFTLVWQHYLVPFIASSEIRFKDARTPRMMLRNFWVSLWMPFIVAMIISITNFIPVYLGRFSLNRWLEIQPWILFVIGALPFLMIPPLVLMWPVRKRLLHNARQQQRCCECGYHLLGVWSSQCPECGSPRFDVAMETQGEVVE
ncbi:MAG: hypothetical protein O7G85_17275 [Planctomycetota bacterium]|nr:hypothetical protein [Planctomycetota bacterium]